MFNINSNRAKRENVDVISFNVFFHYDFFLSISLNIINAYNKL